MKFRVEHVIRGITAEEFEKLYFNEPFNKELCKAVKLDRHLEKLEEKDGKLHRQVKVAPDRQIPGPAAKVLGGDKIEYTEHVDYKHGSMRGEWKTVSSLLTDKVKSAGTFGFKPHPDGVVRWVEGEVNVNIFGLGGIVEKVIAADVEKSYQQAADFTQEWINSGKGDACRVS